MICRKNSKEKWKITGIVSFGVECGDPAQPGVYVNIPHYRKWIDDRIKNSRFTTVFPYELNMAGPTFAIGGERGGGESRNIDLIDPGT